MRILTDDETAVVFKKLAKFVGNNVEAMLQEGRVLRFHKERILLLSDAVLKKCAHIPRKKLMLAGICLGKFTKSKKFRLQITAIDVLSRHAKHKVWLKPAGEKSFIYGNHVIKRHLGRVTEGLPQNAGVVVHSMNEIPLGFGTTGYTTEQMSAVGTETIVVHRHADVGEYLRHEADVI